MTTTVTTIMTTVASATRNSHKSSSSSSSGGGSSVSREITETMTTTPAPASATRTTMTTITSDPGILCFHHCNVKVFCFTLPHICPQCKTSLATYPSATRRTGTSTTGNRHKNKKISTKITNNKSNNNNIDANVAAANSRHSIDSNKDDNANNHQHQSKDNNSSNNNPNDSDTHDEANDDDNDENEDDNDDDDDLNRNTLTSYIMANSRLLPFRLPYPFVRANQYPCAIVLRPTTGDFLNDYNNTTDLHIAVTTSTGCVVEFDRHGLRRHRTDHMSDWWQCLLVGDVPEPWYDYWDQILAEICQQPDMWTVSHYHEDKHNCYTFVLTFLQALTYDKLSEEATSKTRFCEKYIVPRTTTAGKYISLYRKLRDAGIYVHHTNHHKVRYVRQQQQHQQQQQQNDPYKSNNLTATTTTATMTKTKNSWLTTNNKQYTKQQQKQQQQHLSNHHNHHSIISRPHSTLCTIEE